MNARPLAWIDDAFNDACRAWARRRPGATLLVETLPETGLAAAHAERLRAWAAGIGDRLAAHPGAASGDSPMP